MGIIEKVVVVRVAIRLKVVSSGRGWFKVVCY